MDKQMIEEKIRKVAECNKENCEGCAFCSYYYAITSFCENNVVLTKEEYDELQKGVKTYNYTAMFDAQNAYRWEQGYLHGCKETAEKFAERLKEKCRELENKYSHLCKSKKECLMETCRYEGVLAVKLCIDEICKELVGG